MLQPIDVWTTMMIRLDFFHWICAAVRDSDSKQIITSNICCLKVHLLLLSIQTTWHYCSLRPSHCGLKPSAATACLITFLWRLFAERYFQKGWDWEWWLNIGSSNVIYHPCDKVLVWVNQWLPCVQWIVKIVHELVSIQWNLQHRHPEYQVPPSMASEKNDMCTHTVWHAIAKLTVLDTNFIVLLMTYKIMFSFICSDVFVD